MTTPALFSGDDGSVLLTLTIVVAVVTLAALGFAGTAVLIRFFGDRRTNRQERLRELWMAPVLDALADPDGSPFRHQIRHSDRLPFLEMLARISVSLSRDERPRLSDLARPYLDVARDLLRDDDPEFRALGVQLLGLLGADGNRDLVIGAIQDPAPLVSLSAIRALSRSSGADDVDLVLNELPRFEKWGSSLLSTLLASFGDRARPVLRSVMADTSRPNRQRVAATAALMKLNDIESASLAEQILRTSPERELAAACLRLIRRLGQPVQADLLAHLAAADDPVIRLHAVNALAVVGGEDEVDLITMAMADPSRWVAMRASRALLDMRRLDRLQWLAELEHPRASLARELIGGKAGHA